MGDILLATPLIRQAHRAFPSAQIDALVAHPFAPVLETNPYLDNLSTFDPEIFTRLQIGRFLSLARQIRSGRYNVIFILDKHWTFALCAWLAGVPTRLGFRRDPLSAFLLTRSVVYGHIRHESHYYLDLLGLVARADYQDAQLEYHLPVETRFPSALAGLSRPFVVCMNSGGKNLREESGLRRLPDALFIGLIGLCQKQYEVVLLGGKDDAAYFDSLAMPPHINLAGQLSLAESLGVMQRAIRIYTTECGALHMAATTDTPITVFYGPTHPLRRTPLGRQVEEFWEDEPLYDSRYEVHGRLPVEKKFFQNLTLRAIAQRLAL